MFRNTFSRLVHELKSPRPPVSVFDGTLDSARPLGINVILIPKERGGKGLNDWFPGTFEGRKRAQIALRTQQPLPDYSQDDAALLFHWPTFFRGAKYSEYSPLRIFAVDLLADLADLMRQHDPMMVDAIDRAQKNIVSGTLPSSDEQEFFDRHLEALLNTRAFERSLFKTMEETLAPLAQKNWKLQIQKCITGAHRKGQICTACETSAWIRKSTLISLKRFDILELQQSIALKVHASTTYTEASDPWVREILFWQGGLEPADGVIQIGDDILVNFARLAELAELTQRKSPIREFSVWGASPTSWEAGFNARLAFEKWANNKYLPLGLTKTLPDLVGAQGWEWRDVLEHPYGIYKNTKVKLTIARSAAAQDNLVNRKGRTLTRAPAVRTRKIVTLYYDACPVQVIRGRKGLNMYTLPFEHDERDFKAHWKNTLSTFALGSRYWTVQGINKIANLKDSSGAPVYPLARAFCQWLLVEDVSLTEGRFQELLRAEAYPVRVAAMHRGEVKGMGRFTEAERLVVENFMTSRTPGSRLSQDDWRALTDALPGRSVHAIRRQITKQGKAYLELHGMAVYASSPWKLYGRA